jgi:hypothetical protein
MKTLRTLHRWLGLAVFIQVLIWMGSGFLVSLVDMETAAGNTTRAAAVEPAPLSASSILPISDLAIERANLENIRLARLDELPVYRLQYAQGVRLLDAQSGDAVTVGPAMAERIARASYGGDGSVGRLERVESPEDLVGFEGAAWRVQFDDRLATRVFVDAEDGRLLAHRNDRSALVEFLLMLHFMDYNGGHDFNHPLIIGVGFVTLWLAVTGVLLLVTSLRRLGLR